MCKKYCKCENASWKKKGDFLFYSLIVLMLGAYLSTMIKVEKEVHSVVEGISCVFADLICYYIFVKLYFAEIKLFIDNPKTKIVSEYVTHKMKQSLHFTSILNYVVWVVCAVEIILVVFKGNDREAFAHFSLLLQASYFFVLMAYKCYFIDLIVAFGEKTYISGIYTVAYDKIDKIVEKHRVLNYLDTVVEFDLFYQGGKVGRDRWTDTDYRYLSERIE